MMLPRHNGSGLALCSCTVLLPGIYAESGRHASYHQDSNPLSYVDRVGLDRFYNLRSPCTRASEISTWRERIRSLSLRLVVSSWWLIAAQPGAIQWGILRPGIRCSTTYWKWSTFACWSSWPRKLLICYILLICF